MMRACAVVLVLLLLVPSAFSQCSIVPVFSAQFRSTVSDVALDGSDLWAATSYGITLYDRGTDPPTAVASLAIPGTTRVVRVANGTVYAGSGSSIVTVQKNGRALRIVKSVDAGAQVNDLLVYGNTLYAATSNGLLQFDLLDWSKRALVTSSPNVSSLALLGTTLYAADGDSTIEVFNIDIPALAQNIGTMSSLPRVTSVEGNNGKLFASDGRQSQVFLGSGGILSKAADVPFGITSAAPVGGDAFFAGAGDRTFNAFDFTTAANPVGIFSATIAPSAGTVNRVLALAAASNRLYGAAGDAGLFTYDTTGFAPPFPLHSYASGNTPSVVSLGGKVYVPRSGGGITEYSQSATGALTQQRSWDDKNEVLFDGGDNLLLTASGKIVTVWTLISTPPAVVGSATLPAAVQSAALRGVTAYAILSDNTVWTADFSQTAPLVQQVPTSVKPSSIARSGNSFAVAELRDDGTTNVVYYRNGELTTSSSVSVPGIATAPLVLDGTTAAVFTFRGINLIDFATGDATVIPQSTGAIARALAIGGSTVLELTDSALLVWDTATKKLVKQFALPGAPSSLSWAGAGQQNVADVGTDAGIVTVALTAASRLPSPIASSNPSSFYKKVVAAGDRVVLFDGRGADIFTTAMHFAGSARASGMIDVAVSPTALYALFGNRTIAKYTLDGLPLTQTTINDTPDTIPQAIFAVGDAVWVSIARTCTSGCQKATLVYNAALSQTASLPGGGVDVAVANGVTYALTDSEIRIYQGTNQLAARAVEGSPAPVSIAATADAVYVLGEKLYAYSAANLTKLPEQLPSYVNVPGSPVTFVDQHLRAANGCGVVSGRAFDAALYNATGTSWTPAAQFASPSPVRSLAQLGSTFYVLTDHSLEIWSSAPMPTLPRKRPAR